MLTGITTRTSTPQEDAEPWPGGSARPVLDYLTGTLGMTGAGARELLKAARTAQAETGPGTLADYPVPGRDAHLLIHYAPGSRAYRFKLTAPDAAPGNLAGPDGPPRGRETPDGSPAGDAGSAPVPGLPGPPGGAAEPGPAKITVTIWHNVAFDAQGRHTAMLDGYQPGDPVVAVFAYQADPGRTAEQIADEAFDIFNDHPRDADGADLACAYYGRRLRSLRSDGKLTIMSLAAEAGVKRHVLTHKHTDLKDLFNARVRAQDSVPARETVLHEQNAELLRKLDDMPAERDEYKQAADALARALNVLTKENEELRCRASRAREFTGPRPLA